VISANFKLLHLNQALPKRPCSAINNNIICEYSEICVRDTKISCFLTQRICAASFQLKIVPVLRVKKSNVLSFQLLQIKQNFKLILLERNAV
jgi:hypothetical protein